MALLATLLLPVLPSNRSASAQAAGGPDGTVAAVGTKTVQRKPDVARMQVELAAAGKDVSEALANLKAQENEIRAKLAKLAAPDGAVKFDDARLNVGAMAAAQAEMRQRIRVRAAPGVKPPTTAPSQQPLVWVEWPLKATSAEGLLVEAYALQEKVKAADFVASVKRHGMAEDEEPEEVRQGLVAYTSAPPGEAVFLYVCKLSDDDRAKATAEAFKMAQEEAVRVAKAAGAELGGLRRLRSTAGPAMEVSPAHRELYDDATRYALQLLGGMQVQQPGGAVVVVGDDNAEAVGVQPGKVIYRVTVSASFALK